MFESSVSPFDSSVLDGVNYKGVTKIKMEVAVSGEGIENIKNMKNHQIKRWQKRVKNHARLKIIKIMNLKKKLSLNLKFLLSFIPLQISIQQIKIIGIMWK